ncbi:hypothetical protein AB0D99_26545 [Streptomyces sp. NPDC047971]|uniref:hypothetical protein n=1 Tax=Streptomyces sp. NPDC047971 TaxID=3154499 RepID=UPI0033EB679F
MRNPIAHALGWVLIPALLWLLTLTLPPTGTRRRRPRPRPAHAARSLARPCRSGAVQRRRRRALWLATVGLDVDQRDIHAGGAR